MITWVNINRFSSGMCIDTVEIKFGIAPILSKDIAWKPFVLHTGWMDKFCKFLIELSARHRIVVGYCSFTLFFFFFSLLQQQLEQIIHAALCSKMGPLQQTVSTCGCQAKRAFRHVHYAQIQNILCMCQVLTGPLLSIYTFCRIQCFCKPTEKALIRLLKAQDELFWSLAIRCPFICPLIWTISPLKSFGQLSWNFIWSLVLNRIWKFIQMVTVDWFGWAPCQYGVKTCKSLLLQNQESFEAEAWYM